MKRMKKWLALLLAACVALPGVPYANVQAAEKNSAELLKAGSISASDATITEGQPFAKGTADCDIFRIPCLINLKDEERAGTLVAAADARYTEYRDFGGIDTIASVSTDGGKTWNYSFPIYFPDSQGSADWQKATTAIDPAIVEGPDGTIYCFADMNPTGITTFDIWPGAGTGYVEIDGVQRLVLTDTYTKPTSKSWTTYGDPSNAAEYEYYVGDFDENGFAKVYLRADHSESGYGVDEWYNLYSVVDGQYVADLTQTQVNSSTVIQQNAFYEGSVLHVYSTGYIWCVKSYDGGLSWEDPEILNTQIKRDDGEETALLVSPGQGITTSNGDIIVGAYNTLNSETASIFYSTDNGKTWKRSNDVNVSGKSSENEIIELPDGTLRMFYRSDTAKICYADITREVGADGEVTYVVGAGKQTSASSNSNCNVSAILLEDTTIDGKPVILASNPEAPVSWTRVNGKVFVFTLNEDNTMNHEYTFNVNEGEFAYSCMTELDNGNIGMLWEPGINQASAIRYDEFDVKEILGSIRSMELFLGEDYTLEKSGADSLQVIQEPDESIVMITREVEREEAVIPLYNHIGSTASSVEMSFSSTADDTKLLSDAEFTFLASGDNWKIYNEEKNVYLTNVLKASEMFSAAEGEMKVSPSTEVDGKFTICKSDGKRYVIFYNQNMTFDSMGNFTANYTGGSYHLVLLEKQETVSENDVIPGYKQVTEVVDGHKYLIAHTWSDGNVIVLYPANGTSDQTKLVGEVKDVANTTLTMKAVGLGETTVVIDDITYQITVADPADRPDYAGNDLSTEGMKLTAGSLEPSEGSLEALLDGDQDSFYHSNWSGTRPTDADFWITIELPEVTEISGMRYLPRQGSANGRILSYEISYSLDGETWTTAVSGDWADDANWKVAKFDENVEAKYVKIFAVDSKADNSGRHMTAAELRVLKATEKVDPPVDPPVEENDEVVRLFGSGRYETGYAVADALKEALGVEKFEAVVVATGKNFADALAGSYLAVEKNAPILLTNGKDDNVAELHTYIAANVVEGGKVYILGGEAAVPATVEAIDGYDVVRLFGDSRYDTNLEILAEAGVNGDSIIVATGKTFADSLSASAAKLPILLVKPNATLNDAQKAILAGMKNIYIVGGEGAVSAEYKAELAAFGTVTRVYGDSRYDTSVEVAKTFCSDVTAAVVASGKNFPDGLCGGPLAAALNAPLVLTKDGGAAAAAGYVADNGIAGGFVLGGDGALADDTVVEVFGLESVEDIIAK